VQAFAAGAITASCLLFNVYNHWISAWYIYDTQAHISLSGYPFVNGYPDARVPVDRPIVKSQENVANERNWHSVTYVYICKKTFIFIVNYIHLYSTPVKSQKNNTIHDEHLPHKLSKYSKLRIYHRLVIRPLDSHLACRLQTANTSVIITHKKMLSSKQNEVTEPKLEHFLILQSRTNCE